MKHRLKDNWNCFLPITLLLYLHLTNENEFGVILIFSALLTVPITSETIFLD